MNQEKIVTLTYAAGAIVATPDPVILEKGDWILFLAGDDNLYTVMIDLARTYFNTDRKVLMYDVSKYMINPAITPPEKAVTAGNDLKYNVIVTTSTSADRTDPGPLAPPKIIIVHS
jgi:hypothetical protein